MWTIGEKEGGRPIMRKKGTNARKKKRKGEGMAKGKEVEKYG